MSQPSAKKVVFRSEGRLLPSFLLRRPLGYCIIVTVSARTSSSASSQGDVLLVKAVRSLPRELAEAMFAAELVDGGLLMEYPRDNSVRSAFRMGAVSTTGVVPVQPTALSHEPTLDAPTPILQTDTRTRAIHNTARSTGTAVSATTPPTRTVSTRKTKKRGATTMTCYGSAADGSHLDKFSHPNPCVTLKT